MQVVVQVVDGGEHGPQHLAAAIQVVQVGTAEAAPAAIVPAYACGACAGVAGTGSVNGLVVALVARVANLEVAIAREDQQFREALLQPSTPGPRKTPVGQGKETKTVWLGVARSRCGAKAPKDALLPPSDRQ